MSPRLFLVLCLGAVLAGPPPLASAYSAPEPIPVPDCKVRISKLKAGQVFVVDQVVAMQKSLAAIEAALGVCPIGWTKSGDSCFQLNEEPLSVTDALEACRRRHPLGRLASLQEEVHRQLVHGLVDDSPLEQAWIGLRRLPNGWQWSDGGPLEDGGPWLPYQPDNNGGEDCVMYDRTARYPGWTKGWSDERCVLTAPSVCEISHKGYSSHRH